jgi:hypothetical protein
MKKTSCVRCGDLHTHRGMMILTIGAVCKKCIRSGYWPEGGHIAVGEEFEEIMDRLFRPEEA